MALVDMHVHSIHSEHPSEWFLQRIGAAESYTDPHYIYKTAKNNGMNFVTITDHNRIIGSLILKMQYPEVVFTGVESTVYFPEDGNKIHILVYGLSERQFQEIQRLRKDIYQFRAFIVQEGLAYSVAHATYAVNNKLNITHLERLILLFDVFESINGGRNFINNDVWSRCLNSLNPDIISDLYNKYRIEPLSDDPWQKGFTGGSDDHAGFFIGKSYTFAEAETVGQFLKQLKNKKTLSGGRHNDYKSLAFTIYKIAYDFSKEKSNGLKNPIIQQFANNLFENKQSKGFSKFSLYSLFNKKKIAEDPIKEKLMRLLTLIDKNRNLEMDQQFNVIYANISELADDLFLDFVKKIIQNIECGDLFNLIKDFTGILPGIFLALPFFSTLKHMHNGKNLLRQLEENFNLTKDNQKKILWFTDTFKDLNGVSYTLQKIANISREMNENIKIVTCMPETDDINNYNILNLDCVYSFKLPHYETYKLSIPSLLKTIEELSTLCPSEIYISTPGPVGLTGLLLAKLLNIPAKGVYHTDFTMQYDSIDEDSSATDMIETYIKWFYESLDKILVPTNAYKEILANRGYTSEKMDIFKRGIEKNIFYFKQNIRKLKSTFKIEGQINLLYSGRVSKDKNLDFLIHLILDYSKKKQMVNLLIAGDGPYLNDLKKNMKSFTNIYFLGKLDRETLSELYSECDLFVFPSKTDTFGMVVLEALACGLPCVVTNIGGPQELVEENNSGFVCDPEDIQKWINSIEFVIDLKENNLQKYYKWRKEISENTHKKYNWKLVISQIMRDKKESLQAISTKNVKIPSW